MNLEKSEELAFLGCLSARQQLAKELGQATASLSTRGHTPPYHVSVSTAFGLDSCCYYRTGNQSVRHEAHIQLAPALCNNLLQAPSGNEIRSPSFSTAPYHPPTDALESTFPMPSPPGSLPLSVPNIVSP